MIAGRTSAVVHHYFLLALARLPWLLSVNATLVACLPSALIVRCFEQDNRPSPTALKLADALQLRHMLTQLASTPQLVCPHTRDSC
jgi:hypothetical protein